MSGDHNMYCSANQPDTGKQATPHRTLMEQLMDSRIPKTEREYAALQEIERLRRELEQAEETEEELIAQRMSDVADRFAHRLALDLECILPHYSGPWYGDAISLKILDEAMLLKQVTGQDMRITMVSQKS